MASGDGQRGLGVGEAELPSLPIPPSSCPSRGLASSLWVSPPWGVPDAGSVVEPECFQQGTLDSHAKWRPHSSPVLEATFLFLFLPIPKIPLSLLEPRLQALKSYLLLFLCDFGQVP